MKKNILLITSDQQRWDCIGKNNSLLKTPNLDRLSEMGITYDRAYCPHPVCTPSRVSMLTGQYGSKNGSYTIGTSIPTDYPTIPNYMDGYFTSLIGKAHFQSCSTPGSFEAIPNVHDTDFFRSWDGPYYGFEHCRMIIGHSTEAHSAGMHYRTWLEDKGIEIDKYFGNQFEYQSFGTWELPEEAHPSCWTAEETINAMDMAKDKDQPFFIWSSFQDPHNPCYVPEPWASMYDPDEVPVFEHKEGEFDDKNPLYKCLVTHRGTGPGYTEDPWLNTDKPWFTTQSDEFHAHGVETEEGRKKIVALYYGMISLMDKYIGKILDALEERGELENTVIVFTSDHGEYLGNHGLWWKGLPAFEDIQKVPFIVYHPDCKTPGERCQSIQNLINLGQTFLDITDQEIPHGLQGETQTECWVDAKQEVRKDTVLEFRPTESPFMQKTYINDQYKAVFYHERSDYNELYDLKADPDQYTNLWNKPEYESIKAKLMLDFISAEMRKDGTLIPRTMWA